MPPTNPCSAPCLRRDEADYLITGDKDLLALGARYRIISPAQFWTAHGGI